MGEDWSSQPPIQRVAGPIELTAPADTMLAGLTSRNLPEFALQPLGHEVRLEAPAGIATGIANPIATRSRWSPLEFVRRAGQRLRGATASPEADIDATAERIDPSRGGVPPDSQAPAPAPPQRLLRAVETPAAERKPHPSLTHVSSELLAPLGQPVEDRPPQPTVESEPSGAAEQIAAQRAPVPQRPGVVRRVRLGPPLPDRRVVQSARETHKTEPEPSPTARAAEPDLPSIAAEPPGPRVKVPVTTVRHERREEPSPSGDPRTAAAHRATESHPEPGERPELRDQPARPADVANPRPPTLALRRAPVALPQPEHTAAPGPGPSEPSAATLAASPARAGHLERQQHHTPAAAPLVAARPLVQAQRSPAGVPPGPITEVDVDHRGSLARELHATTATAIAGVRRRVGFDDAHSTPAPRRARGDQEVAAARRPVELEVLRSASEHTRIGEPRDNPVERDADPTSPPRRLPTLAATATPRVQRSAEAVPSSLRSKLGPVLGIDLTRVPVHRSEQSTRTARRLQALAFTAQGEVHLPADRGPLEASPARELLAHELVHVAQQRRLGPSLPPEDSPTGRSLERQAQETERSLQAPTQEAAGAPSHITASTAPSSPPAPERVQRAADAPTSAPAPADHDVNELASKLYDHIRSRLRAELLVDRERAGLVTDRR